MSGTSMRLGLFTFIPIATPQPAAAEPREALPSVLGLAAVSLRSLSPRELAQNTGLPASEAEQIRMRDFDELFFFAGATEADIAKFTAQAKTCGYTLQNRGAFWSFSVGADYAKCIRELGALYDRALRYHAFRVGVAGTPTANSTHAVNSDLRLKSLAAACDRTLFLSERHASSRIEASDAVDDEEEQEQVDEELEQEVAHEADKEVADDQDEYDSSTTKTAPPSLPASP